jgi:hypothetical protein
MLANVQKRYQFRDLGLVPLKPQKGSTLEEFKELKLDRD